MKKAEKFFRFGQTLIIGGCILTVGTRLVFALDAGILAIIFGFLFIYIAWFMNDSSDSDEEQ